MKTWQDIPIFPTEKFLTCWKYLRVWPKDLPWNQGFIFPLCGLIRDYHWSFSRTFWPAGNIWKSLLDVADNFWYFIKALICPTKIRKIWIFFFFWNFCKISEHLGDSDWVLIWELLPCWWPVLGKVQGDFLLLKTTLAHQFSWFFSSNIPESQHIPSLRGILYFLGIGSVLSINFSSWSADLLLLIRFFLFVFKTKSSELAPILPIINSSGCFTEVRFANLQFLTLWSHNFCALL